MAKNNIDNKKKGIVALRNKKRQHKKNETCSTSTPSEPVAENSVPVEAPLQIEEITPSFEEIISSVDSLLRRLSPKPEIQPEIFKIKPEVIAHAKWVYDNFTEKVAV